MKIYIDRESPIPVYKQIRDQIRELIVTGVLQPGFKLPPERKLAETLGVNRSTILNAYRDLRADAFISSHIGQGTVVVPPYTITTGNNPGKAGQIPWRQFLSQSAVRMQNPAISTILKNANRSDVISFAAGVSYYNADPVDELLETQNRLLRDYGSTSLQYCATEGHYPLRESLCDLMASRGIAATPEEVIVTAGSQQGMDLTVRILLDPGDIVVVEEPSFFGALQIFQSAGARIMGVPIDQQGIRVDILETLLERYKPKFIYTIPTFQNPSGVSMDLERRKQLLELAYKYQIPVVEDDPYGELRYDGNHLPPLKAMDQNGIVIYLSTFSKIIFPGLRVGWLTAPRQLIRQFTLAKQIADLHTNTLGQWIINDFIQRGIFAKQVEIIKRENRRNRDLMAESLEKYGNDELEWYVPNGGLYFWLRLPEEVDLSTLITKAEAKKVVFVPGNIFYSGISSSNYIRLSFSATTLENIAQGIKLLMAAINEAQGETDENRITPSLEIKPIL